MKPSIKSNIVANYTSQIYLILINIIVLPLYIKYMGAEAYGLVAFFALLQSLFYFLDFGLTPTISRQAAQYQAKSISSVQFRKLLRALNLIFYTIAFFSGFVLFFLTPLIIQEWLNIESLDIINVVYSFQIMVLCVILRWIGGLYKGVILGFEQIVWLSIVNILIATVRFLGVLLYMHFFGFTIINFFNFQLFVAISEFLILFLKNLSIIPKVSTSIGWSLKPIRRVLGFSLTIAFTSIVWVMLTQLDKLVLSGILSLSDFGYFTLATLLATGIMQISTPVGVVIMQRMATLYGESNFDEMKVIYLNSTQLVSILAVTIGLVITVFAEPILYIWTADTELTAKALPILQLYALGNSILALSAFPYYLQYAKGDMRYHLLGNAISIVLLIPLTIWAAKNYGGVGAGWVWFLNHLLFLIIWVSYVHCKIEPQINKKWFMSFLPSVCAVSLFLILAKALIGFSNNRVDQIVILIIVSMTALLISIILTPLSRKFLSNYLKDKVSKNDK